MPNENLVVIAAMARKGGSGKTTLSRALISAAIAAGRRVMLIDTDSTRVLGAWHARAQAGGLSSPLLCSATVESVAGVEDQIDQVYMAGTADFIFIDTAGVGAEWSDGIAVLADHIVTPVMLSTSDFDVGAQTADWFEKLKSRVDDPSNLPRHHVVLNMVDPKTTRADAALIEEALTRFPVIETVMMRRNTYQGAEIVPPRQRYENMIHRRHDNGGGYDARDGRDERVAVQLCRSGGAHPRAASVAQDPAGGE